MRNSEYYNDPTASRAVNEVSKKQPIQYMSKPAYVSRKAEKKFPYPSTKVEEMSMSELRPYILNCAKSKMNTLTCIGCEPGCTFGKRAVEIMEQETNPKPTKGANRGIGMRIKSMKEYQAAISSGDVMKYALEHAKSSDPKKAKAAAAARVAFWRKNYGSLIKENPKPNKDPVPVQKLIEENEQPHLMQMPCLSKKVAAERKAAAKNIDVAKVFADMIDTLKSSLCDIRKQMADLQKKEESMTKQIDTLEATACALGIEIT